MFVDTSQSTSCPLPTSGVQSIVLDEKGGVPSATSLLTKVQTISNSPEVKEVIIDCSYAPHIDAAVLQVLLSAEVDLRRRGKTLRLKGICVNVASQLVRDGIEVRFSGET